MDAADGAGLETAEMWFLRRMLSIAYLGQIMRLTTMLLIEQVYWETSVDYKQSFWAMSSESHNLVINGKFQGKKGL